MVEQLYSPNWSRVANVKPALRSHTKVHRHLYRGVVWYVIEDLAAGRVHRFTPSAYRFIAMMDGCRTVDDLWETLDEDLGDDAPTQDDIVQLLANLYTADLMNAETPTDTKELFKRLQKRRRQSINQRFLNPTSMRFGLVDPDRILSQLLPFVRPIFSIGGLIVWFCLVSLALILAGMYWGELTENIADRVLTAENLFVIWLVYPFLKLLHELAHGLVVKRWYGEVHEMGIMLLVFAPVPYVDASSAAAFKDKRKRMLVGAIGIMVELLVAALALFVWLAVEPGIVRSLAFNLMLIGGVSTVLFNGNPLLRFDAYYVLADWLELPNLSARANKYVGYLVKRYGFGIANCESSTQDSKERLWLVSYAVLSYVYRMIVMLGIAFFVSEKFFVVGILLAIWVVAMQVVLPVLKQAKFLLSDPELSMQRPRALTLVGATIAIILGLFIWFPMPLTTMAQGVVWAPDRSEVRAGADGVVVEVVANSDRIVEADAPLLRLDEPLLKYRVRIAAAKLREAEAHYNELRIDDPVQSAILMEEIKTLREDLALARTRLEALTVYSQTRGNFLVEQPGELLSRYVRNGDLLGYIVDESNSLVRVVVSQQDIALIRKRTDEIWVRLADQLDKPIKASVTRLVPAATNRLPSRVLGTQGGGSVPVDPADEEGLKTLEGVFHLELEIPSSVPRLGGRVYVRFDHGTEPLAQQAYRHIRQLFLSRFNV